MGPPEHVVVDMGWMHGIVAADVPVVTAAACPYSLIGPRGSAEIMQGRMTALPVCRVAG